MTAETRHYCPLLAVARIGEIETDAVSVSVFYSPPRLLDVLLTKDAPCAHHDQTLLDAS